MARIDRQDHNDSTLFPELARWNWDWQRVPPEICQLFQPSVFNILVSPRLLSCDLIKSKGKAPLVVRPAK